MNGAGPNQVSQIDYGSAAGVRYLVATVENFKSLLTTVENFKALLKYSGRYLMYILNYAIINHNLY